MPIRISGLNSGLDTESIISALVSSYNYKTQKYEKAQTKLSWKQDAWKELNTKIYSLYNNVGNLRLNSSYKLKTATVSDATKVSVTAGANSINGSYSVQVTKLAKSGYMTGEELGNEAKASSTLKDLGYTGEKGEISLVVSGETKKISVSADTTIQDVVNQLKEAGVNASFDAKNKRIFVSAKAAGEANDFELVGADAAGTAILNRLGLTEEAGATRVEGSNAEIYVNGAKYTNDTNTFSINNMTFTASAITGEDYDPTEARAVNVIVNTDTQAIYDKVKDFLSQYNSIINEMTSLYNAESAKGYEPLTSDEKDAMSETEVEKWEAKIKASILRRDDTLSSIISTMTSAMSKSVNVNGENLHLSDFGIQTLGFLNAPKNEHNAYHIDGDEDDANTSGKTDKLMAAIAEDPDKVIDFMMGLSKNLYEAVDKKMKSTTLSSSYTIYNDKEMASEYSDYTSLITKWQDRLTQQEEYYYKKFAAMETALSKLNSQTSSLSGLFGGM
ncbi:MAG: flagellar filament capping protein FliD [Roseburia sp.]|nr:flagellar filament capping protein FliD [Roseburia sp.]